MNSAASISTANSGPNAFLSSPFAQRVTGLLGLLLVLFGVVRLQHIGYTEANDFGEFYAASIRYIHGQNPYLVGGQPEELDPLSPDRPLVLAAYSYPPMTTALLSLSTLTSQDTAQRVWTNVMLLVLTAGLWCAVAVYLPTWNASRRLLLLGVLLQLVSLRWIFGQLQITALCIGGLGLFLYADARRNDGLLIFAALLVGLKPTLFLPIVALLLFRRRAAMLGIIVGALLLLNLLGALPTGIGRTIGGYRLAAANFTAPGTNNHASVFDSLRPVRRLPPRALETTPGTVYPAANGYTGEQTGWTYLWSGWTHNEKLAGVLGLLCSLTGLAAFVLLWRRAGGRTQDANFLLLIFTLSCCYSLLCIYHQRYDVSLMIFPLLFALRQYKQKIPALSAGLISLFLCGLYTENLWQRWQNVIGPRPAWNG